MITLSELNKIAAGDFPEGNISLPKLLVAWASKDPKHELRDLLEDTGIGVQVLHSSIWPFLNDLSEEDSKILTDCIIGVKEGSVLGWHLLNALADAPEHRIMRVLVDNGLSMQRFRKSLEERRPRQNPSMALVEKCLSGINPEENIILQYGRDLTALAKEGAFDDLCERDADMERLFHVLLKKKKGNAVLTGHAGVGKTALVELLSRCIVEQRVPEPLKKVRVFELNIGKMVAGTNYRGMFEERLEKVLAAVKSFEAAILFIDEMHLIWGAGKAEGAPLDAANMLKPVLARGEIRVIGATTAEEYHQYIRRDEALARRFEEIMLEQPKRELVIKMVEKQVLGLAEHHKITISGDIVLKAVELADRYLPNRFQPDKTVDLLDACCVYAISKGENVLTEEDLLAILARQTCKNIESLKDQDKQSLKDLAGKLKQQVIGQDQAVDKLVKMIIYRRQDFGSEERNLGTFLFAGPTGVGKTELSRVLAREFFGDANKLLHIDLAEYSSPDSINKLIGAPAGFVGHDKEGILAVFMHTYGSGVLLFDEIEKANRDIQELLLGLLDNGRIRTAKGEMLDAKQCIVIATTNAISQKDLDRRRIGFGETNALPDMVDLLTNNFPRELLGRFDELILFNELGNEELKAVMNLRLNEALERLKKKNVILKFDKERLVEHLLDGLQKSKTGARGILRLLEQKLLQPIALVALMRDDHEKLILDLGDPYYESGELHNLSHK